MLLATGFCLFTPPNVTSVTCCFVRRSRSLARRRARAVVLIVCDGCCEARTHLCVPYRSFPCYFDCNAATLRVPRKSCWPFVTKPKLVIARRAQRLQYRQGTMTLFRHSNVLRRMSASVLGKLMLLALLLIVLNSASSAAQSGSTTVVIEGNTTLVDNTVCKSADWRVSTISKTLTTCHCVTCSTTLQCSI